MQPVSDELANILNLSFIQTATRWHDAAANRELFDGWFEQLPEATELVVLPEMFSTGFTMASAEVAEPMTGTTVCWLREAAQKLGKTICGSLVIVEDDQYFNRFVWVSPTDSIVTYDKRHTFRMAGEHEHYTAGGDRVVIELNGWRMCPMICYDLRFPVWFRNRNDYDVLLCVANWPAARQSAWQTLLRARAIENQSYVVGVNILGVDGADVRYAGGSAVHDPQGEFLLDAGTGEGVFNVALDRQSLEAHRTAFPAWQDADEYALAE